jgi:hypothetical protein
MIEFIFKDKRELITTEKYFFFCIFLHSILIKIKINFKIIVKILEVRCIIIVTDCKWSGAISL